MAGCTTPNKPTEQNGSAEDEGSGKKSPLTVLSLDEEALREQAQEEGTLTLAVPDQAEAWEKAVKPFEDTYQIDVNVEEVPEGELAERLSEEKASEQATIDAMITRGVSTQALVDNKLLLGPIEPVLFEQDTDTSLQQDGVNSVGCLVPICRYQTGILYRTDKVHVESWEDVAEYLEENRIVVPDPNKSMAGRSLLQSVILNLDDSGTDYSKASLAQEIKAINWQSALEWLSENWDAFLWTEEESEAIELVRSGAEGLTVARSDVVAQLGAVDKKTKFYVPEFHLSEGSESVGIALASTHPAASLLLVNWLVSEEGQQSLYDARKIIPLCETVTDADDQPVSVSTDANASEFLPSSYQEYLLKKYQSVIEAVEQRKAEEQDAEPQDEERQPEETQEPTKEQ
ncbi:MAG: ABC transporter substrate-binding protein [Butyricicoccaceae bacterium]